MKKILAIVLALCLVLSLSVVAFADDLTSPVDPSPEITGTAGASTVTGGDNEATGKFVYTVTTAAGEPLSAIIRPVYEGEEVYDVLAGSGVVAVYEVTIYNVDPNEIVKLDVYAPGVSDNDTVLIYDEWELGSNFDVSFTANGNRAIVTGAAGVFNTYHYFAIVSDAAKVVEMPQEGTEQDEEGEEVDETPEVTVPEENEAPATGDDANPGTGIALAVVPMIVAAAAVVVSKKR